MGKVRKQHGSTSDLQGPTPPPKPKRLKKGPFNMKSTTPTPDPQNQKKSSKNARKRKKSKPSGKVEAVKANNKAGNGATGGEAAVEPTKETKERLSKIKNTSRQEKSPKKEIRKMIVKPGGKWYENEKLRAHDDIPQAGSGKPDRSFKEKTQQISKSATTLYEKDCFAYKQACMQGDQKSDFQWMEKMMKVGTLPDKMAAYVVKIQDSPVHNIFHLQNLISMVKVQSKQQCLMAADTLRDLFLEDLLPRDRKLIAFDKRGESLNQANEVELITWTFEDRLKLCYASFVDALSKMSRDTVDKIRAKAIYTIFELLAAHPEQEAVSFTSICRILIEKVLLQMLVNKLGDTMKKVASKALFYLNSLLQKHPRMKLVVIDEVERLLFRNNIAKRAQYYGVCFLNSINLQDEHPEVACKLINVYVAFFKGCIKTGDIESKMMSALLTGVNKSYPSTKDYGFKFTENMDTLYKIAHLSNFNIGIQALSILFQLTDVNTRPNDADRYYRVLYAELLRPEISTSSHIMHFLNLVFKSMKCDNRVNRVMGFAKRLLMVCQNVQPNLACAILFLLSEVTKVHSGIIRCGKGAEQAKLDDSVDDEDDEEDQEDLQTDDSLANLMKISNVKVNEIEEEALAGGTKTAVIQPIDEDEKPVVTEDPDISITEIPTVKVEYKQEITDYDPNARNPCYCGAEFSLCHEIVSLSEHYHPSVALFAKSLLRQESISYPGNPLKDFTISRFLERFVYRNSKKPKVGPGGHRSYQPKGLRSLAVNSADYLKNEEESIPAEEKFFYRYFKEKKETDSGDVDSDAESVGDDEFDELMSNYFKSKKGKDNEDDDEDFDFAGDLSIKKTKKGKKGKASADSDEDSEDEGPMDDDGSEDEEFGEALDADEMVDLDDDDDDDLDLDFQDEEGLEVFDGDYDEPAPKKTKRKLAKGLDMFAPAEQFAEMLESNADIDISGPTTLISRDNADPKQLQWEMDRDRWAKGYKRNPKSTFKGKNKQRGTKPKNRK